MVRYSPALSEVFFKINFQEFIRVIFTEFKAVKQKPKSSPAKQTPCCEHRMGTCLPAGRNCFSALSKFLQGDFVLDDAGAVTNNLFVQKGFRGIPDLLKADLWHFDNVQLGYYRPLS